MQTPAEKNLVQKLATYLNSREPNSNAHQILNAGAGQSVSIERQLLQAGCNYKCDRIDVEDCQVDFQTVGECWQCSIDDLKPLKSEHYIAGFANYVLEHVENIGGASRELYRVLAPSGLFVATIPNVAAPEFIISRHTPQWFHKMVRRQQAWETIYAYDSISELLDVFLGNGFRVVEEKRWPFVEGYLGKYPLVGGLGKLYDTTISTFKFRRFMGDVCLVFQKPAGKG